MIEQPMLMEVPTAIHMADEWYMGIVLKQINDKKEIEKYSVLQH